MSLTSRGHGGTNAAMSVLGWFRGSGASGFGYDSTAEDVTEGAVLAGKTFLVTGATSGLGRETSRVLLLRGARVLVAGRTLESARLTCRELGGAAVPLCCDLSEPQSVAACATSVVEQQVTLDAIVCNAGLMLPSRVQTKCGHELQFLVNHIGHFILVTRLLQQLSPEGRVVMVSSEGHRLVPRGGIAFDNLDASRPYAPWTAYGQSKLANLLFAVELAERFAQGRQTANAVHPGVIVTQLTRNLSPLLINGYRAISGLACKSISQGAATQCYVATHPHVAAHNGKYFADCNLKLPSAHARDRSLARRLWLTTESIVGELLRSDVL